jgi:Protein required for attachment to host cells
MTPQFLIVADRGMLKAFNVESESSRRPTPRLVAKHEIDEAHGRFQDRFSDQAGSFQSSATGNVNETAERMGIVNEIDSRIFRQLSEIIDNVLGEHSPDRWSFAAPSEINPAILDGVAPQWKDRLQRNVPRNLVKTDAGELLGFFDLPEK